MGWRAFGHRLITGQARGPGPSLLRAALTPASWLYGGGVAVVRAAYARAVLPRHRFPCPVVSVGNLTWGGTGKTPLTALLAQQVWRRGRRPAILLRGYGGDEALVLRRLAPDVPVWVGPDRVASGRQALAAGADLLFLDDGFQQWRVARDLDLVLVNGATMAGGGALLPRGTLREPRGALRRADVVIVTKTAADGGACEAARARAHTEHPGVLVMTADYRPVAFEEWPSGRSLALEQLRGQRVGVLSGIGDPDGFEALVRRLGLIPVVTRRFLDHHPYTPAEVAAAVVACRAVGAEWVVTTLKDAVRFPAGGSWDPVRAVVLHVAMELQDAGELLQRILSLRGR